MPYRSVSMSELAIAKSRVWLPAIWLPANNPAIAGNVTTVYGRGLAAAHTTACSSLPAKGLETEMSADPYVVYDHLCI